MTTTGVTPNTTVGYTITGIDAADISLSSLTGTIAINNNSGSVSFTAVADTTTEGNETVTLTLDATDGNGASTGSPSDTVVINDTSTTPAVPTYAGSFDVASINEDGSSTATFTVTTTNVANGTIVGYTISGVSVNDISLSSLTGEITISGNSGSVSFTAVADTTTEGNETVTLTLDATDDNGASTGSPSDTVIINDTSEDPVPVVTSTMDTYPLTNNQTVQVINSNSSSDQYVTSLTEGYLLVEESGSNIIVYAAAADYTGTTTAAYFHEGSASSTSMNLIPSTGTNYSNKYECFRISIAGGQGWSVAFSSGQQDAWGSNIVFNPTSDHPTTINSNYGSITSSAQQISTGTNSRRALRLRVEANANGNEVSKQDQGSVRLTFTKTGQTTINVDTNWNFFTTAVSTYNPSGGGFGGGGAGGAN